MASGIPGAIDLFIRRKRIIRLLNDGKNNIKNKISRDIGYFHFSGAGVWGHRVHADDIQFNTDLFDVEDRQNIDVSNFTHKGYIMPGRYP